MERFQGMLLDARGMIFGHVSGAFEGRDERGERLGRLEVHEGSAPILVTRRPYRLALSDGHTEEIVVTDLRQSGTAGIARLAFRIPAPTPIARP